MLLEPIAGPSKTKRTRICPKCEQVFDEDKVLNHGCDHFECNDQDCYKLFKYKKIFAITKAIRLKLRVKFVESK